MAKKYKQPLYRAQRTDTGQWIVGELFFDKNQEKFFLRKKSPTGKVITNQALYEVNANYTKIE